MPTTETHGTASFDHATESKLRSATVMLSLLKVMLPVPLLGRRRTAAASPLAIPQAGGARPVRSYEIP